VGTRHDREHERGIAYRARHWPVVRSGIPEIGGRPRGDPPKRRLETEDAAKRGWDADRSRAVGSVSERPPARGHRRAPPSGGSARRALYVPRIGAGRAEQVVAHVLVAEM